MKICIVCSAGGHLLESYQLKPILNNHEVIWVTFKKEDALSLLKNEKVYWAYYPMQRNYKNLIFNFFLAYKIFKLNSIDIVISTGAGVAIPFFILGKICGKKTIFIETIARINNLTLTGKVLYKISDLFIVQWPELQDKFPKAIYKGRLI